MFCTHFKLIILDHTIEYLIEDTTSIIKTKYANNSKFIIFTTLIKLIISITNYLHMVMAIGLWSSHHWPTVTMSKGGCSRSSMLFGWFLLRSP